MHIALAQISPVAGNLSANSQLHCAAIDQAAALGADALFFPELSLTGYEPTMAEALALPADAAELELFEALANRHRMTIGLGLPLGTSEGIQIALAIFQPQQPRRFYAKQQLHADELPFFVPGNTSLLIDLGAERMAPAICYESLQWNHAEQAAAHGATIYLAMVAKSAAGIAKANAHFPQVARRLSIPVLMVNATGPCDNFVAAGASAYWDAQGVQDCVASGTEPALLVLDTDTNTSFLHPLP